MKIPKTLQPRKKPEYNPNFIDRPLGSFGFPSLVFTAIEQLFSNSKPEAPVF
jgi:hypothetical protein